MKVCDRHPWDTKEGKPTIVDIRKIDPSRVPTATPVIDLCDKCFAEIKEFIKNFSEKMPRGMQ